MTIPELRAKIKSAKLLKQEAHKQANYWTISAEAFGNEIRNLELQIKEKKK